MKTRIINALTLVILLSIPTLTFAQAPSLGTAAGFVLFSTDGAVSNTGITQLTGNVGTNNGSSTGFGNVNGIMHDNDGASAQCAADLLIAYNQLNNTIPTFFPAPLLGNGQILNAGVYSISTAATLNLNLILDGQGNAGAVFIFQIQGAFSTGPDSKVKLVNGAQACNVFWKVEGLVSMASGTTMRGTLIANNAAIIMNTGDTLEGRILTTAGAVTVHGVLAYTPVGCGSPLLNGPLPPVLGSTACYALFSSVGPVSNTGITHVSGDIGTNVGAATGFDPLLVTGTIHLIPDGSTAQCAADLLVVYNYLNTLPHEIELLYPAQFGNNLVLTPHTYLLSAATQLTDTVTLNAMGNADAVFVIKINGALTTNTYSKVKLINGAQAKNVYWKIEGAVSINNYSVFRGTIVCNNGALGALNTGVVLDGRALTTTGALTTAAMTVNSVMPAVPATLNLQNITVVNGQAKFYSASQTIIVAGSSSIFRVEAGGSATMIAGQYISYLPGTNVLNGGYLHGYISASCGVQMPPIASTSSEILAGLPNPVLKIDFLKVYPNPANNLFTVETKVDDESVRQVVSIYSTIGTLIVREEFSGNIKKDFSLANQPVGIYIIQVIKDDQAVTVKLVKK